MKTKDTSSVYPSARVQYVRCFSGFIFCKVFGPVTNLFQNKSLMIDPNTTPTDSEVSAVGTKVFKLHTGFGQYMIPSQLSEVLFLSTFVLDPVRKSKRFLLHDC